MDDQEIKKHKGIIDNMGHVGMARLWRFAESGHTYFRSDLPLFKHFEERFKSLGGMTPEISKRIGWDK